MNERAIGIPNIIEQTAHGERGMDIFSRLLMDRIVLLGTQIDDVVANIIIAQLLFLQSEDPKKDIDFWVNSPGGSVTAGLAIYDTMQILSCDVRTYCVGQAASMGAILLSAGTAGKRYALPNARIMMHQPQGGGEGTAADISIRAKEMLRLRDRLNEIIGHHTSKETEQVRLDTKRDYFMSAEEAREYGVVDSVLRADKKDAEKS
ncbi:MAG TPA: ATP-dependent Clp protease proteolytic subunit [Lentisphaeria bacterium]|nr:ATP-dependent Clp protease proteolytic subunit [Lentisphaeria bacterium]